MSSEIASESDGESIKEYDNNSLNPIPNGTIFAYNLDDRKTPGGLKVRWKFKVVTGPEAAHVDARQAEAIMELLRWASRHPPTTSST